MRKLLPIYGGVDAGARPVAREQVFAAIGNGVPGSQIVGYIARALDEVNASCAPVPCARGCGWCCHQRVEVTAPEVFALADRLRAHAELLRPRLQAAVDALRGLTSDEHHLRRVRCALLDDEMACTAHDARPLACRRAHSLDASICRGVYDEPAVDVEVPADATRAWNTGAVILGYHEGFAHHERALDTYELNAALLIALDEDLEPRWAAGENVLAAARTHSAEEIVEQLR